MSNNPNVFRPPLDWEAAYADEPDNYFFGEEPSAIACSAMRYFRAFGGKPKDSTALDLGCGEGRDTAYLAKAGFHVTARDLAPAGLAKMTRLLKEQGTSVTQVDSALGDVREFPYPQHTYDLALAANVFQFLPPEEVPRHIQKLQGTTKPGGICAVGVFSPAMLAWGADIAGRFVATADELVAFFPAEGWLLLDRTDYWTYRLQNKAMASFAFVIARKQSEAPLD